MKFCAFLGIHGPVVVAHSKGGASASDVPAILGAARHLATPAFAAAVLNGASAALPPGDRNLGTHCVYPGAAFYHGGKGGRILDVTRPPFGAYHAQNFLESIRSCRAAIANIDEAFQSDALCHLSHLALKTGRKLTWDPKAERFVKDKAADRLLACREMRKPWKL